MTQQSSDYAASRERLEKTDRQLRRAFTWIAGFCIVVLVVTATVLAFELNSITVRQIQGHKTLNCEVRVFDLVLTELHDAKAGIKFNPVPLGPTC